VQEHARFSFGTEKNELAPASSLAFVPPFLPPHLLIISFLCSVVQGKLIHFSPFYQELLVRFSLRGAVVSSTPPLSPPPLPEEKRFPSSLILSRSFFFFVDETVE